MMDMTAGPDAVLRYLAAAGTNRFSDRVVDTVVVCGPGWRMPADGRPLRDGLALLPTEAAPAEVADALRDLVGAGVVAAVLTGTGPTPRPGDPLVREAARLGLPLLAPARAVTARALESQLMRRQLQAAQDYTRLLQRLAQLANRLFVGGQGPDRLLQEAGKITGGPLRIIEPGQEEWETLAARHGAIMHRIRQAQVPATALLDEEEHLLLHAAGQAPPHPLLAAWRPAPWPRHLRELAGQVAGQIAMLTYPVEHQQEREAAEQALRNVRAHILQFLMLGEWETAARVATSEHTGAGMLAADRGVMAVVQVAEGEPRDQVAHACEQVLPQALVVLCPADYRHVLILAASPTDGGPDLLEALRPVVAQVPGRSAGVSTPQRWTDTADAYSAATQALAAAATDPDRIMRDPGATPLAVLLSPRARVWARQVRSGIERLGEDPAGKTVKIARRALTFGTTEAASMLQVDRSTARKRLATVMEAMGLDHRDVTHRAVADLVFHLCDLPAPDVVAPIRPRLRSLLQEAAVITWAEEALAVLDDERGAPSGGWLGRGLEDDPGQAARRLAATWLEHNCHNAHTSTTLGVHRNTLPTRLAALGARLRTPLLSPGYGPYSVLWQLAATGQIQGSAMPDPTDTQQQAAHQPPAPDRAPGAFGVYDYYRGGSEHHLSERVLGEQVAAVLPNVDLQAKANRAFVLGSARYLAETCAVRQFLDIGAGRPSATQPNLHDVVGDARVVYVDHDEDAVRDGQNLLADHPQAVMVEGDLRQPDEIMSDPAVTGLLDWTRPVAVCMHTVLHYILNEEAPRDLVEAIMEPLPSGSYLSITHGTTDIYDATQAAIDTYRRAGFSVCFRSRHEITDLLPCDMTLLDPGIVPVQDWAAPGATPAPSGLPNRQVVSYALIARKP